MKKSKIKTVTITFLIALAYSLPCFADYATGVRSSMNSGGDTVAIWLATESGTYDNLVQVSTLSAGGSWSAATTLYRTSDYLQDPRVAIDNTGNMVAVWLRSDPIAGVNVLLGTTYSNSSGVWSGTNTQISSSSENVATNYTLHLSSSGEISTAWNSYLFSDGQNHVRAASGTFPTWDTPVSLSN